MKCDIAFVIVTYNSERDVERCVSSICAQMSTSPLSWHVVVVDNHSRDGTVDILQRMEQDNSWLTALYQDRNCGFGVGNNVGFSTVEAEYYALINADAWLVEDCITGSIRAINSREDVAICGLPLIFPDGRPQTFAYAFTSWKKWAIHLLGIKTMTNRLLQKRWFTKLFGKVSIAREYIASRSQGRVDLDNIRVSSYTFELRPVDWVCGAAMIIKSSFIDKCGGFDPQIFLYGEDEDLCICAWNCGMTVEAIDAPPVVHVFGWGQNRFNPVVAGLKYRSLRYFINKNIKGALPRMLMLTMLPFRVYGMSHLLSAFSEGIRTDGGQHVR